MPPYTTHYRNEWPSTKVDAARIGVLAGSVVAAIAGALVLVATGRRRNRVPGEPAQG